MGADVFDTSFPAPEDLPPNVKVRKWNAFDLVPDDLVEEFDVLHVRTFALVIKGEDPTPLLKNVIRLLSTSDQAFQPMSLSLPRSL